MKFSVLRNYIKFRKWGKYVITLAVFLVIYLFVGDQSMVQFYRRRGEIKVYEQQTRTYRRDTKAAQRMMQMLNNKDSLERYARELYFMHEKNEDIYIVDQK